MIKGKYLAWSIIHLNFFLYIGWVDLGLTKYIEALGVLALQIFLGWRFIENMEEAFGK